MTESVHAYVLTVMWKLCVVEVLMFSLFCFVFYNAVRIFLSSVELQDKFPSGDI